MGDNFLDDGHALIVVRLPGNASIDDQARGADVVDDIVARHPVPGAQVLASGPPVLLAEINDYLRGGMATLGALAVGVMALLLLLVFRVRWRLLPWWSWPSASWAPSAPSAWRGSRSPWSRSRACRSCSGSASTSPSRCTTATRRSAPRAAPEASADTTVRHMGPPLSLAMVAAVVGFLALLRSQVP